MDVKTFLMGAASGALAFAAVSWLLDADPENGLPDTPRSEPRPTIAPIVELPVAKENQQVIEIPDMSVSGHRVSEKDVQRIADRRAELEAEPKDDGWAYYMEQTILQFLTSHPAITQFDISYIDCRTTVCNIQVIGYDESTVPTWQQIIYDLRQQPWSDFEMWGSSVFIDNGRPVTRTRLHRQQSRN